MTEAGQAPVEVEAVGSKWIAMVRLGAIGVLAVGLFLVFRYTPIVGLLSEDGMAGVLEYFGPAAAVIWVFIYAILIALWVPGTPLTAIGAAVFGRAAAIPLNYCGAVLGSSLGYLIARLVGGDSLQALLAARFPRFLRYQKVLEARGFEAVLYLRLVPTPYTMISWLGGLSPVGIGKFTAATAIGIIPGSIAFTYVLGTLVEFFATGDMSLWFEPATLGSIALYAFALSLPLLLAFARRKWGWFAGVAEVTEGTDEPV